MSEQSLRAAHPFDEHLKAFAREFALRNFIGIPRVPLYHYTTGDSLVRIIESKEIWSTQASCLNDMSELLYAAAEFRKRVRARLSGFHDPSIVKFLACLDAALSDAYSYSVRSPIFVSCFSEHRDDLSQWRAYAGGEGGYAIQLDSTKLAESLTFSDGNVPNLVRIEYECEEHGRMFNEVLKWVEDYFVGLTRAGPCSKEVCTEFVRCYVWRLGYLAACLKHPKFKGEREWRLIYDIRPDDRSRMEFRQRQSMMCRHFRPCASKPLPIVGVLIGPCRHPELSRVAVGDLSMKNGYDPSVVIVEITEVPYRSG